MKILLIEDRSQRQNLFLDKTTIDLANYSKILDNVINEEYKDALGKLKTNSFDFDDYTVIIVHESAFDDDNISILKNIEEHCKKHNKIFILFSGGVDSNYYLNEDDYVFMKLSSSKLYSQNIKLFLDDFEKGNTNPLILSYGEKWKINVLLNILEKINFMLERSGKASFFHKTFICDSNIELIKDLDLDIYQGKVEDREISQEEVVKIIDSISCAIKRMS